MDVPLRDAGDRDELRRRIKTEPDAKQRDRYRAALLAIDGEEAPRIVKQLSRSRRFVQRWAYAYRDGGIESLAAKKPSGRPTKLPREKEELFRKRMLAGPTAADGVCTLRGNDAVCILEKEFGVRYTLDGVYDLLARLGLACLKPRPRHRKNDPQVMREWLESAPFLSAPSVSDIPANR
jgi:transposase